MESSLVEYFELNESKQDEQDAPLLEENFSPAEPDRTDDSTPLADADPYTAPEQAETNETDGEEKPPEEVNQDTE